MRLKSEIKKLRQMTGFKNDREQQKYLKYAKKIDPSISKKDLRTPQDYIDLLENHLEPLPSNDKPDED